MHRHRHTPTYICVYIYIYKFISVRELLPQRLGKKNTHVHKEAFTYLLHGAESFLRS